MPALRLTASFVALIAVCGCSGLPVRDDPSLWRPIDRALSEPLGDVRLDAASGSSSAQYALSILYRYGLRGVAPDRAAADSWLARAMAAKRVAPRTALRPSGGGIYVGEPAEVGPEVDLQFDLTPDQDALIRRCLALLSADAAPPGRIPTPETCGGAAAFARMKSAWRLAVNKE